MGNQPCCIQQNFNQPKTSHIRKQKVSSLYSSKDARSRKKSYDSIEASHYQQSFIYDPEYLVGPQSSVFLFQFPSYSYVENLLRKEKQQSHLEGEKQQNNNKNIKKVDSFKNDDQIEAKIKNHIKEIQVYMKKLQQYLKNSNQSCETPYFKGAYQQITQKQNVEYGYSQNTNNEKSYSNYIEVNIKNEKQEYTTKRIEKISNIINFELLKINIAQLTDDSEQENEKNSNQLNNEVMQFKLMYQDQVVSEISGQIQDNIWKPTSVPSSQVRVNLMKNRKSVQNQNKVMVSECKLKLLSENLECTIPCNNNTFRHLFPIIQMANIHKRTVVNGKKKSEVVGNLYFRIQLIQNFDSHTKKVIQVLRNRGKSLTDYLQKQDLDRSILIGESFYEGETYKSSMMNEQKMKDLEESPRFNFEYIKQQQSIISEQEEEKDNKS